MSISPPQVSIQHDTTNQKPAYAIQVRHGTSSNLVLVSPGETKAWHVRVAPDGQLTLLAQAVPVPEAYGLRFLSSAAGELYLVRQGEGAIDYTVLRAREGSFTPVHHLSAESFTDGVASPSAFFLPDDKLVVAAFRQVDCGELLGGCYDVTFATAE